MLLIVEFIAAMGIHQTSRWLELSLLFLMSEFCFVTLGFALLRWVLLCYAGCNLSSRTFSINRSQEEGLESLDANNTGDRMPVSVHAIDVDEAYALRLQMNSNAEHVPLLDNKSQEAESTMVQSSSTNVHTSTTECEEGKEDNNAAHAVVVALPQEEPSGLTISERRYVTINRWKLWHPRTWECKSWLLLAIIIVFLCIIALSNFMRAPDPLVMYPPSSQPSTVTYPPTTSAAPTAAFTMQPSTTLRPTETPTSSPTYCGNVPDPSLVGNGWCDGGLYMTADCSFDGGDCDECYVPDALRVGDGNCDGGDYIGKECGYDGGDCESCRGLAENVGLVGDGNCDGGTYASQVCGYDGEF